LFAAGENLHNSATFAVAFHGCEARIVMGHKATIDDKTEYAVTLRNGHRCHYHILPVPTRPGQELPKMTDPLVSVSMITYNHAPFIAQAIDGVLQQKVNFPIELVIGEDCSPDDTRKIVFEYQKKFPDIIRVITSDKNVGMKQNGLRLMKACQGKYIAFCEGDDFWQSPHKLQKQVEYLDSHPECGLVFTDYDFYYNGAKKSVINVNYSKGYKSPMNMTIEQILGPQGGLIRTCTVMVRRKLLEQVIEGDPYLHQSEQLLMGDIQLFAELSLVSKVSYYPESMATYRIHGESATRSKDPIKTARFCISASEIKSYLCDKHKLSESIRKEAELAWCHNYLRIAFYTKNKKLADEIRKKKKTFTLDEWIKYYCAKNSILYYPVHLVASLGNILKRT
jgi:glycosyltransferase involved in cell wall biosynthesis